jgi:hypothetical protein
MTSAMMILTEKNHQVMSNGINDIQVTGGNVNRD